MPELEKVKCSTPDFAEETAKKILALLPECAGEGGAVDIEKLKQCLSSKVIEGNVERYEFTWPGKRAAKAAASAATSKTLRPCAAESVGKDGTPGGFDSENLYIEGDNLEVLKLLQTSYANQVKMIYIDPPYNTGHDFVYRDRFSLTQKEIESEAGVFDKDGNRFEVNDSSEARYHSNWCSMMYPRLKLARNLLAEDGLLFVSIDDNEANNLKRICDEIFGERNYLNQMAWVVNITGRQISGNGAAKTWESVFVYAKNAELAKSLEVDISFAKKEMPGAYKGFEKDIRTDAHGEFAVGDTLYNHNRKFNEETRRNLVYSIFYNPKTEEIVPGDIGEKKDGFVEILPHENGDGIHKYHAWRWSRQKVIDESYDLIALPTSNGGWELHTRIRDFSTTTLKDLITNISNGDAEVQKLFDGKKYFDYPKSVALMSLLINSVRWGEHATILDFFSGSGTTGHAVLATNAKKKRNYKFILVQLPQECDKESAAYKAGFSNICEIAKERIRRASKQIADGNATTAPDLDMGFRVLKLDSSSLEDTAQTVSEINQLALKYSRLKADRSADDLLFQVLLETRLPLSEPISKVEIAGNEVFFVGGAGAGVPLVACLDAKAKLTTEFFLEIAKLKPGLAFFRDDAFADDSARTNVQQAFDQFSPSTSIKVI